MHLWCESNGVNETTIADYLFVQLSGWRRVDAFRAIQRPGPPPPLTSLVGSEASFHLLTNTGSDNKDSRARQRFSQVRSVRSVGQASGELNQAERISGGRSTANETNALAELRAWMKTEGLRELSPPVFAYFDPPWTPPFLRRNEVMLRTETVQR
jgi:hypothetical protein